MARAKRITVAPFLKVDNFENEEESVSVMSPLPPPLKGTFVDKLPSWSQTTNNPDTFLNVNSGIIIFTSAFPTDFILMNSRCQKGEEATTRKVY